MPPKSETQKPAAEETPMALEIVSADSGEVATVDFNALGAAFAVDTTEGIRMLNSPREWRAMTDKAAGYFQVGGERGPSKTKIRILNYRTDIAFFGESYGPDEENVIQTLFIDEDNVVASLLFRGPSMEEFKRMADNVSLKKKPLVMFEISMEMEKKQNKAGINYYLVRFQAEEMKPDQIKEVFEFVKLNPTVLQQFRDLPRK